jgi:hypothetical protein
MINFLRIHFCERVGGCGAPLGTGACNRKLYKCIRKVIL